MGGPQRITFSVSSYAMSRSIEAGDPLGVPPYALRGDYDIAVLDSLGRWGEMTAVAAGAGLRLSLRDAQDTSDGMYTDVAMALSLDHAAIC